MCASWWSVCSALGVAALCIAVPRAAESAPAAENQVDIGDGRLEGGVDAVTGVRAFKGIPFAAPPVGDLRWREPQPVKKWKGVRLAHDFGPRAMQQPIFGDMVFRSNGMSEDCLYLNVWTPARSRDAKLPVLVYFYGGGYVGGDGSEGRYDGASMARQGMVAVTVNYRLGVFGFLAHPELTKESPHHASGNYALLDQRAALQWVQRNIAAFGGDPKRVTIAGESAGSISVSAQMASPISKGLFAGAIGESGSVIASLAPIPLADAEAAGAQFGSSLGASTLAALRAIPADRLLEAPAPVGSHIVLPTIDGYFLPKHPRELFASGQQAHVPLLAGVNSEESGAGGILQGQKPTVENYQAALTRLYGAKAGAVFARYPATNEAEVNDAARDLASDRFISYGTWTWMDLATKTGGQPTYYYLFTHPRPGSRGAGHSVEIEYALGNLGYNKVYAWTPDDYKVSQLMQSYFANFVKTGNPNGADLPTWPKFETGQRLVIDVTPRAEGTAKLRARAELLDSLSAGR